MSRARVTIRSSKKLIENFTLLKTDSSSFVYTYVVVVVVVVVVVLVVGK